MGLTEVEHRALKSVFVQFFVNGAVVASYIPRLPEIRDQLDLSLPRIGLILAVTTGIGVLGSVIQAPIISTFGTRRAMTVASLVLVLGLASVGFAVNTTALVIALSVVAISDVVTDVAMNMQGSSLSARRSSPVVNRLHGLWSLGTVVGGVASSLAASAGVSLQTHLIVASVVLAGALAYVAPGLLPTDDGLLGSGSADEGAASPSKSALMVVLLFIALGGAAIVPEMLTSDWAAFRLADDLGAANGTAGLGYVAFTAGMVAGRFCADAIVDQHGPSRVLRIATGLTAVGTALAMITPFISVTLVGLVVTGLGVSVMFPQIYDAAVRSHVSKGALGGLTAGSRGALLLAPIIVGNLADTDALSVGVSVATLTLPAAVLVLVLSREVSKGPAPVA